MKLAPTRLHLPHARLISAALDEPRGGKNAKPKYRITLALDPADERDRGQLATALSVKSDFDAKIAEVLASSDPDGEADEPRSFIQRGEEVKSRGQVMAGCAGNLIINASSFDQPALFDEKGGAVIDIKKKFMAGARVHAILRIYGAVNDDKIPNGVYADLAGVKYISFPGPLRVAPPVTASDFAAPALTPGKLSAQDLDDLIASI